MTEQPPNERPVTNGRSVPKTHWTQRVAEVLKSLRDPVTHIIALGIVGVFLALIVNELWNPSARDIKDAKEINAILGSTFGIVIGFYFGSRSGEKQAEAASAQVSVSEAKRDVAAMTVEGIQETKRKEIEDAEKRIADLQKRIQDSLDKLS